MPSDMQDDGSVNPSPQPPGREPDHGTPHPPQDGRGLGGNGASAPTPLALGRAAQPAMDPYGAPPGFLGLKNRFQETTQLMARLHRYELVLRKHWWILALALCASLGPAFYHVKTTPASYQSTGKLWMSGKLDLKEGQLYMEELSSFIGTQVELLRSLNVYNHALSNLFAAHPDWRSLMTNVPPEAPGPFQITVTDYPKTAVIEVKAVGPEADAVRGFVNTLMEEYQTFRKSVRQSTSDVTLSSITEQVKQLELDVRKQQERLQGFLGSNNVVLLQEQGSSAGTFAAKLNRQLASLRTELKLLELITPEQLAQARGNTRTAADDEGTVGQGTANELLTTLAGPQADFFRASQQIQLLKAKREELLEFLRPSHAKILKLDDSVAEQEKIIEVFKRQSLSQMGSRREALGLQITNLESSVAEWEGKALDASRKMADYDRIRQDLQRTQALYEKLLAVIQQVDVNRTLDQENIRVMDAASKPKAVRRTTVFLGLGLAGGLFLGLGLLYIVGLFDDRFASLKELSDQVPEVVIGQIPEVHHSSKDKTIEVMADDDKHHAFCEAFRNVRSWVLFSGEKAKSRGMLLITSSVPSEGKTTVSANLAITLALSGARVLLIDADLRRADLNELFGVPDDARGLAEVLEQRASAEDVIRATKTPKLSFLPAGSAGSNPGELFLAPSCDIFLARIRKQYDYVLIDSAPVLATDDTANLAPKIDAVLFIVRGNFTSARNAREGLNQLHERKANVLGLIFNRSIATRSGGYYYRYNKYYYYGSQGKRRRSEKESSPAQS